MTDEDDGGGGRGKLERGWSRIVKRGGRAGWGEEVDYIFESGIYPQGTWYPVQYGQ